MQKLALLLFALVLTTKLAAQDKHFTQFYASPLNLNPALTGVFEGKYRVGLIYRDQWRGVLDQPLKTFAVAADLRFNMKTADNRKDAFGLGLLFFQDKASVVDFSTTQIALSGAYHKSLDYNNTQFLTLGVQAGITQRNLNYESLNFHDEFDGLTGYTGVTAENLPSNNFSFGDISVGVNYSVKFARTGGLNVGLAMHHATQPIVSFYQKQNKGDLLYRKFSAQVAANLPLVRGVDFQPRFLIAVQGPHMEMNTGANFRFGLGQYSSTKLHLGSWVRPVKNNDGFGLDAVVILAGVEFSNILVGASYDVNLGALSRAKTLQGAFEISIAYLGEYENEDIVCPKF